MKQHIVILACLCGALAYALPVSDSNQENIDLVQIPLKDGKELDILTVGDSDRLSERNKRTIGILRDLFPELSKQVDDSVNKIVGQLIRAIGPSILRTAVRGNTATTNSRTSFDSDFDDDDDSDSASTSGARVKIELPTFDNDDDDDTDNTVASGSSTTTEPNFQYSKNVDAPKSDSDILSISLNSDLINRTDNGGDDADSTDNEDKSNNDDDENKDNDNSENSSDSTTEESGSESGNSSSSASDDDNDSTTKSDDSNVI